ncbi:MAG: DUF1993 domain-containing protein, partial [Gammaproteobacteria bacterium]
MAISMYQASIPVCIRALTNLEHLLRKGEEFADQKKIKPGVLLNSRLAIDMLPLLNQVQLASDTSKGAGGRLAGIEVPKFEDNEQTFADLYERIGKTVKFLGSIKPEQLDGSEDKIIVLKLPSEEIRFTGITYLFGFVLPNLGFHVSTAYNILRHNGVNIGKRDY